MNLDVSYINLVTYGYGQLQEEGIQAYPIAAYEVTLLEHAQYMARQKEANSFQQLNHTVAWQLSHRERDSYVKTINSGDTMLVLDVSKTIVWTSHRLLAMTGYTLREIVGKSVDLILGTATEALGIQHSLDSLLNKQTIEASLISYRKSGEAYRCQLRMSPLFNGKKELTHLLITVVELPTIR